MIAVAALVVVLAGWYFLLWSPAASDLDAAKERSETAKQRQAQLQTEISRLRAAQADEPKNRARLETLRTAIPDEPALGQFILDVNDAATRAGIDFISIAPSVPRAATSTVVTTTTTAPSTGAGGSSTTPTTVAGTVVTPAAPSAAEIAVQLQVTGGYFQVLDFLNRLDALPRLVVTDTVNVSGDTTGRLTVGMTSRIFVRAIPAGFAGAAPTTSTTVAGGAGGSTTTTVAAGAGAGATTTTAGARP
jgi:Tfp pilus assembly protein PilO